MTVTRLAISKDCLADYAKLDKDVQRAVDQAVATFARQPQPGLHLEKPQHVNDDRFRILSVDGRWRGVVLTAGDTSPPDTYSLVTVLPRDQANAYVASHRFSTTHPLKLLDPRDTQPASQPRPSHAAADLSDPRQPASALALPQTPRPDAQSAALYPPPAGPPAGPTVGETPPEPTRPVSTTAPLKPADPAGPVPASTQLTQLLRPRKSQFSLAHPFAAWRRSRTRTIP